MHLMFSFINTALIPLSQTSLTIKREMTKLTNTTLSALEQKVNTVIQKTIDSTTPNPNPNNLFFRLSLRINLVVLAHITLLLSRQRKADFKPRDDEVRLTTLQTPVSISSYYPSLHITQLTKEPRPASQRQLSSKN